jgi:formylglycine-generating enzyme required for sulfatase activity
LDDLAGKVWEWCLNEYANPEHVQIAGEESRVLRGGSWNFDVQNARCASRSWFYPNYWFYYFGFRVVVGVPI